MASGAARSLLQFGATSWMTDGVLIAKVMLFMICNFCVGCNFKIKTSVEYNSGLVVWDIIWFGGEMFTDVQSLAALKRGKLP